jgi:hypothetical protein
MSKGEDDRLKDAKEAFQHAADAENKNRKNAEDDIRFCDLEEQWPEAIRTQREKDQRPCLTINKLPAFKRQVVNDARQNKPSIKVHPCDSNADKETADVMSGLIRNIEYTSNADVAYDTAIEQAVTGGFGYFTIDMDYAHDDTFDLDISIKRVADQFSIYGDPSSKEADSSDWNTAFQVEMFTHDDFERQFKGAAKVDWQSDAYSNLNEPWCDEKHVMVARWWTREEVEHNILLLSNGSIIGEEKMEDPEFQQYMALEQLTVQSERPAKSWKVERHLLTGAEVLKEGEAWPGRFIPIIPVYGTEINLKGERIFKSLISPAKDAQRQFNYWRTAATELVALAPRVPFIGPKGAFVTDAGKWNTINTRSHAYVEYDVEPGMTGPPQRQPFAEIPAAALQEAMSASDDMKAIMGLHDASLGARSNEVSGKAIMARQREGDVSTFHFSDNMSRAIRHAGRILIDLIPHVYSKERIIRVMGEDGTPEAVPLNQPVPVVGNDGQPQTEVDPKTGQQIPMTRIYDLASGKYDLTVSTGPSYTTRREEAAQRMVELGQAHPPMLAAAGDLIVKNLDFPGADELAERLKPGANGLPPEMQKQIEEGQQKLQQLEAENAQLKGDQSLKGEELKLKQAELQVKMFEAETDRMAAQTGLITAQNAPQMAEKEFGLKRDVEMAKVEASSRPTTNVQFDANKEIGGVAQNLQALAQGNNEAIQMAAQTMAQTTETMASALNQVAQMVASATQQSAEAATQMAGAARLMAAPKKMIKDPLTGEKIAVPMVS